MIHQRSPQEFQCVWETDERKDTDGLQVEANNGQPGLQRSRGEGQWQPRRKPQGQHDADAPVRKNLQ